jgi:hypothetical protein
VEANLSLGLFRFWRFGAFVRYRQLERRGLLTLLQKRQENDGPICEFQRVVMGVRDFLVDLLPSSSPTKFGCWQS